MQYQNQKSAAMIVLGFKQIHIEKAIFRPGTKEEKIWENKWLPTPWNEIEVGLGAMLGLPILLVKDNDIHSGIFDSHLSESFIAIVSANDKIDDAIKSRHFNLWLSKFKNTDNEYDTVKESFINSLAKQKHDDWCRERISQGLSYNAIRNNGLKEHPYLVDYESLPDSEIEYLRHEVSETFNNICKNGFKISRQ